jgi:chemotaxis protein CheX
MRFEYVEPFVACTMRVLGDVLQAPVARGEVSLVGSSGAGGDLAIAVPLFGDSEGNVELRMNTETAVNLSGRLNKTAETTLTPLGLDSLAELANMIAGNAVSALNDQGFDFILSSPHVLRESPGDAGTGLEAFCIPLATPCGDVTVQVTLKTH